MHGGVLTRTGGLTATVASAPVSQRLRPENDCRAGGLKTTAGASAALRAVRRLLPVPGRRGTAGRPRVSAHGRRACRKAGAKRGPRRDGDTRLIESRIVLELQSARGIRSAYGSIGVAFLEAEQKNHGGGHAPNRSETCTFAPRNSPRVPNLHFVQIFELTVRWFTPPFACFGRSRPPDTPALTAATCTNAYDCGGNMPASISMRGLGRFRNIPLI